MKLLIRRLILFLLSVVITACFGGGGGGGSAPAYTIGGTVSGLASTGLVLQNNNSDDLVISANGDFIFNSTLKNGTDYNITILTHPSSPLQTCSVSNGSGTVDGADITN
ncbi:MAG: hypothetical protein OEY89_08800, partial [Gammaproteobacteria bacterium]|nr:hypothetical protein [Gammaproteobacteria bacterium]